MTPEQAACLGGGDRAVVRRRHPNDATGERDLRPAGQRRVEALTEVCRARSSGLDADGKGSEGAAASTAALHVTIALTDLEQPAPVPVRCSGSTATGVVAEPGGGAAGGV